MPQPFKQHNYTPMQEHMAQLYRVCRTVDLNVRYYGIRAATERKWSRLSRGTSAVGSSVTLAGVVAGFPGVAMILAGVASLSGILAPLFLWEHQMLRFEKLHFAYCELLHDFKNHIREITLAGTVTEELQAISRTLFDRYSRLGPQDEVKPNRELIKELEAEVKNAMPTTSLWMPAA